MIWGSRHADGGWVRVRASSADEAVSVATDATMKVTAVTAGPSLPLAAAQATQIIRRRTPLVGKNGKNRNNKGRARASTRSRH